MVIRPGSAANFGWRILGQKIFFLKMNNMLFEHRKRSEYIPQGYKLTLFGSKNPIFFIARFYINHQKILRIRLIMTHYD